ncbi:unnamed protein product [Rotaria magnacalcarata]|uniref:Uncharacterized protein n=2 Tax=Rotaria magnacalcarata TaxID=392030 RepID=A0A8S2P4E9_9BILA|nr:unnamed protein product [Rotaria magnacalcarata]
MPVDLNNLPDDILSYRNNCLYKFIEENFGTDEMMLIKMQSINNISTLITVPDIMAFLNFNCKEIIELKNRICFIGDDNNQFMVKSGIQTNINNLISALKEKRKKQMKRTKPSKPSSQSSTQLDSDQSNTSSLNISNLTSTDSQLTPNDDNSNTNNTENVSDDENLGVDDSFSTTTNNSITTVSNCSKNKRPLPLQSTSSITKKTKSS